MDEFSKWKYKNAQIAHQRFFDKKCEYESVLQDFSSHYAKNVTYNVPIPAINLIGVPSRERIILIAEITKIVRTKTTIKYRVDNQEIVESR